MSAPPVVTLTSSEFAALAEYSRTLPTGTTIGKRWRRKAVGPVAHLDFWNGTPVQEPDVWWMGEYVEHEQPDTVGIRWSRIEVSP